MREQEVCGDNPVEGSGLGEQRSQPAPSADDEHARRDQRAFFRRIRAVAVSAVGLLALLVVKPASARPGTHPIVTSTWDARASSVVLGYHHGSFSGGGFNIVSYHANFSSTSGLLSAQFGLYYENYRNKDTTNTAHGMAASANAVFNVPVARRFENGLPLVAINPYIGAVPTVLIAGERNYITIPVVLGIGVPVTPSKYISIVPWFELSPGVNLDTVIKPYDLSNEKLENYYDAQTGKLRDITSDDVERIVRKSVELKTSFAAGFRGGLDLSLHASDYFDFNFKAAMSSVGGAFDGPRVLYLGGGISWRWDNIVPAVLPSDKRLLRESCDAVEERFVSCPNSSNWRKIEADPAQSGPSSINTPTNPAPTTPSQPASPAPAPSPAPAAPTPAPAGSAPAAPSSLDAVPPAAPSGTTTNVGAFEPTSQLWQTVQ